ncbi:uncharacterized protein LOC113054458 [Carassius auratus]|uniref:Uncharacterized protein LOC113054458 n=1 Tax=Carassius auratus TaxID=7957 RepID=A0A6P6KU26_CARAU|nr:uncharacterized protein LOC113054458 [Carassius auratus]
MSLKCSGFKTVLEQHSSPNANLTLNSVGPLGSQSALCSTPPPPSASTPAAALTYSHSRPQPSTPASAGGHVTPTHIPSGLPRPPSVLGSSPAPSQPLTPLQSQPEPSLQMQQPTSVQAQQPSTPLSQMSASVDNRVPTPASVKEAHSQHALPPDYPAAELKTEHQDDEQDYESGKKQPDLKMEDEDVKPPEVKEQPESVETKQEQMETEEKKPEIKTEPKEEELSSTNSTTPSSQSAQSRRKIFKPEELRQALMPTLEALYRQDPESLPFRQPVDPTLLGIPVNPIHLFTGLIFYGYLFKCSKYIRKQTLDVFSTFEEMKTVAPGLSRQGFLRLLEQRTEQFGRSGKIHGDAFQRSFVEYTFCQFLCEKMANVEHFTCPACTPNMLAVSADGNRKLYRFQHSKGSEEPYFEGIFIAKDVDVSSFVEEIRNSRKGTCGATQWSAARETARRASKLDEEGLEKELQAATNIHFYCTDISCKYWPYLQKMSVSMPELSPLLQMRPFLSVMHAKAHSTKCEIVWSGRNQEGAGATAGEEVEMVNSFLSRCALTTKYMTKSARNDMLTVHAIGWNRRKHDGLHLALSNRYVKTVRKAEAESQRLENLSRELGVLRTWSQQWVDFIRNVN